MTKQLSPAAKAVLDATNQAYDTAATVAQGTAVALRAAATAVAVEYIHLPADGEFFSALRKISRIADELETQ